VDLEQRLGPYEVTAVPGASRLRLVWSMPSDEAEPRVVDGGATAELAILADYRATRAPVASQAIAAAG